MVRLNIVSGPDQGLVYELVDGQYRIGREPQCQIALSDGAVSRQHALLTVSGVQVLIEDLGSRHGTQVAGAPVHSSPVRPSDTVQVGATVFTVEPADDVPGGLGWTGPSPASGITWRRNLVIFAVALLLVMLGGCCMLGSILRGFGHGRGIGPGIGGWILSDRDYDRIENGMTQEEVIRICGQPMMREPEGYAGGVEGSPEVWHYGNAEIDFRDQKVVAKRRITPGGGG